MTPLGHGKSFNNRIYFVTLTLPQDHNLDIFSNIGTIELTLKVNGRFFDAAKVENEVACLCLLEEYVADSLTPRVIGWSGDGKAVNRITTGGYFEEVVGSPANGNGAAKQGWLLMTKVPGESHKVDDLAPEESRIITQQLAAIVASWRTKIPPVSCGGNIRIARILSNPAVNNVSSTGDSHSSSSRLSLKIGTGFLGYDLIFSSPVSSLYEYYKAKLECRLHKLTVAKPLQPNRDLAELIRKFLDEKLSDFQLFKNDHKSAPTEFIFTHYDISPRNILVSTNPLRITGIVDFEFSGYFPEMDEFLNDSNNSSGGFPGVFPDVFYNTYLAYLEDLRIRTPLRSLDKDNWRQAYQLTRLEDHIAPWWLENGEHSPEEQERELRKAKEVVLEAIRGLCKEIL